MGERSVHMRRDYHFAEDDPSVRPQYFNASLPHLPLIPYPDATILSTNPKSILWLAPRVDRDFCPAEGTGSDSNMGTIQVQFRQLLRGEAKNILRRVKELRTDAAFNPPGEKGLASDQTTNVLTARLKYLLGRLELTASFREAASVFCLVQWVSLELEARLDWLTVVRKAYANYSADKTRQVLPVVGAMTKDLEVAENLWRAGVPVWLVRPLGQEKGLSVITWYTASQPSPLRKRCMGIDYDEESPPHPVVFKGKSSDLSRYREMSLYLMSLASSYASQADSTTSSIATASSSARPTIAPIISPSPADTPSSTHAGPSRTPKTQARTNPYAKKASKPKHEHRNKFVDLASPLLPPAIPNWLAASKEAGEGFNPQLSKPYHGAQNGYALPDPNSIVGTAKLEHVVAQIHVWLKLRDFLLYRLRSPKFRPMQPKEWRAILQMEIHPATASTETSNKRQALKDSLMECVVAGNMLGTVDLSNLHAAPLRWQGEPITTVCPPPEDLTHAILWELHEINFRWELLSLDRYCYELKPPSYDPKPEGGQIEVEDLAASTTTEREMLVLDCIPHFAGSIVPSLADANKGFASTDVEERREALVAWSRVMKGWARFGTASSRSEEIMWRLSTNAGWTLEDVDQAEYYLVYYYVHLFRLIFNRAPVLPHRL